MATGWNLGWRGLKTLAVTLFLLGMLAANVASLVSSAAHDFLYGGLRSVLLIGGEVFADRALRSSKTSKNLSETRGLRDDNKRLLDTNKRAQTDLDVAEKRGRDLTAKNQKLISEAEGMARTNKKLVLDKEGLLKKQADEGRAAKQIASKVRIRATKNLARNTAAIPAEAIPYLGLGVVLAVTTADIYDACQTAKDFNELLRMMGQGEEQADMCGQKLPTKQEVLASARAKWQDSLEAVAQTAKHIPGVALPEARLPSLLELRSSVCPFVKWTGLCP